MSAENIDAGRIGAFAMEAIDSIIHDFTEEGIEVIGTGDLMLVVEIRAKAEDGDGTKSHITYYSSEERPHMQMGLLRCATLASEGKSEP